MENETKTATQLVIMNPGYNEQILVFFRSRAVRYNSFDCIIKTFPTHLKNCEQSELSDRIKLGKKWDVIFLLVQKNNISFSSWQLQNSSCACEVHTFAAGQNQGCHLAFFKAKSAQFGLFWNCLPEIKRFGHLAIFWPFLNVDKKSIF